MSVRALPDVDRAIEVFARGFAFTRTFTHPFEARRIGPAWVIRDSPRKRADDYRREEWVAHGVAPQDLHELARKHTRGRYCLCPIRDSNEPDAPLRAAYKSLGYRLGSTEPMMAHRLARIPRLPEPFTVQRVLTQELADRLAEAAGRRQILAAYLAPNAPLRQYVALDGATPIGWARSVTIDDATWISNVHVHPSYRRRGVGRSLLCRLLRDDREHGIRHSVLLSSHTGALLYPTVGYELIGELLLYTPVRSRA